MITVRYIFHSCFVVETDSALLVFDYWMDPACAFKRYVAPSGGKHIYVFASHFHEDHFTREIFRWREENPFTDYTYILSKDILKHRRANKEDADVWMAKGAAWHDANISVRATGSTDSGVSWIVEADGKRIFHAGDLGNWYARFLADGLKEEGEIYSEEFGMMVNPVAEEKRYLGELKDIRKTADGFDIAMLPVDGRIGNGYTRGARQFIERFRVGLLIPMHFVMSGFESAWRMEPFCQEKGIPFWRIQREGECIAYDGMIIRRTLAEDLPRLMEIYSHARQFMASAGNANQWINGYPSQELLLDDINSGDSFVMEYGGRVVATFVLRPGNDPTYARIYNGEWLNDLPYATIHRIASSGERKGVWHMAMRFAKRQYINLRIDTHSDNKIMQRAILSEGFRYCGIILTGNGTERLAYQYAESGSE